MGISGNPAKAAAQKAGKTRHENIDIDQAIEATRERFKKLSKGQTLKVKMPLGSTSVEIEGADEDEFVGILKGFYDIHRGHRIAQAMHPHEALDMRLVDVQMELGMLRFQDDWTEQRITEWAFYLLAQVAGMEEKYYDWTEEHGTQPKLEEWLSD